MPVLDPRQLPKNAGMGWSQACGFWRGTTSVCPVRLRINGDWGSVSGNCYYYGRCSQLAVSGGWITGSVGQNCAGSDAYCTVSGRDIYIDIWQALAAGVWSSSVVFTIYADMANNPLPDVDKITVSPESISSPAAANTATYTPAAIGAACSSTSRATLTVYDNGTFTLT
jgi:hypothetical protein